MFSMCMYLSCCIYCILNVLNCVIFYCGLCNHSTTVNDLNQILTELIRHIRFAF